MMRAATLAVVAILSGSSPALALDDCSVAVDFDAGALRIGIVKAKVKKSQFEPGIGANPGNYVVAGDEVMIGSQSTEFLCALYVSDKGEATEGWLKTEDLTVKLATAMPIEKWLGKWTAGEWHNIEIKKGKTPGWIDFTGESAWANSAEAAENGGLNEGSIGAVAPIIDGMVGYTADRLDFDKYLPYDEKAAERFDCAARLKLLSRRYLMVEDNRNCGGHNVSSTGMYVRKK